MIKTKFKNSNILLVAAFLSVFLISLTRVHLRVQTTMIGYELGRLKGTESELLEKRSFLKMELAKLTTKSHLTFVASMDDEISSKLGSLAAK